MSSDFDPYYSWLGVPPEEQPPDHYRLLGIRQFESNHDVIRNAADQRITYLKTLSTSRHAALSQELLNVVSRAKVCLLNDDDRRAYDQQLLASIAVAYPVTEPQVKAARPIAMAPSPPTGNESSLPFIATSTSHRRRLRKGQPIAGWLIFLVSLAALAVFLLLVRIVTLP